MPGSQEWAPKATLFAPPAACGRPIMGGRPSAACLARPRMTATDLDHPVAHAIGLLFPEQRMQSLQTLKARGLVDDGTLAAWNAELAHADYGPRLVHQRVAAAKIELDRQVEAARGELSSAKTLAIIDRLVRILRATGHEGVLKAEAAAGRTALDFGAGLWSPLSSSIVMFANGFGRAIAHEPFALEPEYATASVLQTLKWLALEPARFDFSGIGRVAMRNRLACLDFEGLPERLAAFGQGSEPRLDFGGVVLSRSLEGLAPGSVDLVFSNSVLEHVADLPTELARQHRLLSAAGLAVHTVDFSDHRSIGTGRHVFQMYHDGVLENINGLRPSQVERLFAAAGFHGDALDGAATPPGYVGEPAALRPPFNGFGERELSVWVRSYVLRKAGTH